MSRSEFDHLVETWQTLGEDDPLWAVASQEDKRGGRWELEAFLRTGEEVVARYQELLGQQAACPARFTHVLDFGCGVGRLGLAWSRRANQVTGVDIAPAMIERGRQILEKTPNVGFVLNQREDLACFQSGEFDLVFSHICLQHMPWTLAAKYVAEFARVCQPGGFVAFHLPARSRSSGLGARVRKRVIEALPFGLDAAYRRWRHGSGAVFDLHCTPPEEVVPVAQSAGLTLKSQVQDEPVPGQPEGYIYVFRKSPRG
jgi:SAM-dependent methyltransferase